MYMRSTISVDLAGREDLVEVEYITTERPHIIQQA